MALLEPHTRRQNGHEKHKKTQKKEEDVPPNDKGPGYVFLCLFVFFVALQTPRQPRLA
jgi:hypothetical protein